MGRRIIICDGAESARLWSRIGADLSEELTWVPREGEGRSRPPGFRILQGGLDEGAIAKLDPQADEEYALVSDDGPWTRLAVREIRKVDEDASILVLSDELTQEDLPDHASLRRTGWKTLIRDDINEEFDHLANLHRVAKIRRLLDQREKIAILVQPDPDPDGIASAYALRTLLGRKRTTAPIVSFGEVQRPENQAFCEAVGIDVKVIAPEEIADFDGLVLVDVQPNVFGENPPARLKSVDLVVDHHPERSGYEATIRDIRTSYGATSSIVTEYLRATNSELNAKLATALLYGIKSDTQYLGRETSRRDMQSFAFLHASHSPALLRRIERPALPLPGLRALGRALAQAEVRDGIHMLVLGHVREDVIPQVADMALQAQDAEWAIAVGIVNRDIVFSVRNVGYVRAAGEVVRAVVEGLGVGGGHRSMAKGIIPLKAFREVYGRADRAQIRSALYDAFTRAIYRDDG
ncbi:MAG: DHH family phosphoesterase [Deltaproteobacteria bacterium]|nr:DHH family phosphoesterase [Deltaproteobacteria bacterium]